MTANLRAVALGVAQNRRLPTMRQLHDVPPRNLIALVHPVLKCKSGDSGVPMPSHKFKIGDVVALKPAISRNVPGGTYQVTKRLPENQGEFEYCIKNLEEPYARVVRESELRKA
jgi:hypothetical protein